MISSEIIYQIDYSKSNHCAIAKRDLWFVWYEPKMQHGICYWLYGYVKSVSNNICPPHQRRRAQSPNWKNVVRLQFTVRSSLISKNWMFQKQRIVLDTTEMPLTISCLTSKYAMNYFRRSRKLNWPRKIWPDEIISKATFVLCSEVPDAILRRVYFILTKDRRTYERTDLCDCMRVASCVLCRLGRSRLVCRYMIHIGI